jgi:NADH:ubiquinone reductase (H+-translocating)
MANGHRVVILGGGFGGLNAAQALKSAPVDVTLIDRRNYHLFQPLLYQVATGSLSPGEIAAPLRGVLSRQRNARVLLGEVIAIEPGAREVQLRDGAKIPYDTLVVSIGTESSYVGNDQWREWAPSLKSIEEATMVRHKILYAFEAAERESDPEEIKAWLTFVIVGAGPTGLELAGALAEISRETLRHDFRNIRPDEAQIVLMEYAPRVLPGYPEVLSKKALKQLERLGVKVHTGVRVVDITREEVTFESQRGREKLTARTVLWAGGISASGFARTLAHSLKAETDKNGRIKVNPDLSVPGRPEIFIVGDLALSFNRDGTQLPGVAQVAIQGGDYVAKVIRRRIRGQSQAVPFRYFDKGDMAVIGRGRAVANLFGKIRIWGPAAWFVWLFIHLMYLVEFQSRVLVFIEWGFLYITHSRGARLITGKAPSDIS